MKTDNICEPEWARSAYPHGKLLRIRPLVGLSNGADSHPATESNPIHQRRELQRPELIPMLDPSTLLADRARGSIVKKSGQCCDELGMDKRLLKQDAIGNALGCPVLGAVASHIYHRHG